MSRMKSPHEVPQNTVKGTLLTRSKIIKTIKMILCNVHLSAHFNNRQ